MRGTLMPSRTVWNWGESPRCPAVTTRDSTFVALFTRQVDLGGQPAAGASQRVVVWFCREATGRLLLLAGVSAGAGGVLVRPGGR
jgi:hypothetical protein